MSRLRQLFGPKRTILLLVFVLGVGVAWYLRHKGLLTPDIVFEWIETHPVTAPIIFCLIYIAAMLLLVPTMALNLGAGFIFGISFGSLLTLISSMTGACLAFYFARSTGDVFVERWTKNKYFRKAWESLDDHSWRFAAFVRLNPIFPTSIVNYLFGLTPMNFRSFFWPTLLCQIPFILCISYVGSETRTFIMEGEYQRIAYMVLGCSAMVTLMYASKWVRQSFFQIEEK